MYIWPFWILLTLASQEADELHEGVRVWWMYTCGAGVGMVLLDFGATAFHPERGTIVISLQGSAAGGGVPPPFPHPEPNKECSNTQFQSF